MPFPGSTVYPGAAVFPGEVEAQPAPDVVTNVPRGLLINEPRLKGTVDPEGAATNYHFEYWRRDWLTNGQPFRTNYCTNPTLEVDLTGIAVGASKAAGQTITRVTSWAADGVASVEANGKVTAAGGFVSVQPIADTALPAAAPGEVWGASAVLKVTDAPASGNGTHAFLQFLNASKEAIENVNGPGDLTTGVRTLSAVGVAPAGTAFVRIRFIGQTNTVNDTVVFLADCFLLERIAPAGAVETVFDSLSPASGLELHDAWAGEPDGIPTRALTGQEWMRATAGKGEPMEISGGTLTAPTPEKGAAYLETELDGPVKRIGCRWAFSEAAGNEGGMALIAWATPIETGGEVPDTALHLVIFPNSWGLGYFHGGSGTLTSMASGFFAERLTCDGVTQLEIEVLTQGDTHLLHLPDGSYHLVKHPMIEAIQGTWANLEINGEDFVHGTKAHYSQVWATSAQPQTGLVLGEFFPTAAQIARGQAGWNGAANGSTSSSAPVVSTDSMSAGSGSAAIEVEEPIDLGFGEPYMVRLVATNPSGTSEGEWVAFESGSLTRVAITLEHPPSKIAVIVKAPDGTPIGRWAEDEGKVQNVLGSATKTGDMPGGDGESGMSLARDPKQSYPDQSLFAALEWHGVGGERLWSGTTYSIRILARVPSLYR